MKYLSPFYILPEGFEIESLNDKKSLKKARKLVLAEFELLGKTTITVNGQELDKNAVLNYFEALEKDSNLKLHIEIFQNKALLSFLESGQINTYKSATNSIVNKQYGKAESTVFVDFIAPYFTAHFNDLFSKAVRQNDIKSLEVLFENGFPLPQRYEVTAYETVYRWYYSKLRNAESIEEKLRIKEFVSSKDIKVLIDKKFIRIFNQLPTYFHNIRDKYAFKLYEIVVILNNDLKRISLAREIVDVGILIQADYSTMQYFQEANKVIDKEEKSEGKFNWIWLYVIFQAIFILSRVSTCSNSSTVNTLDYSNINSILRTQQDSILRYTNNNILEESFKENREQLDSLIKMMESKNYEKTFKKDSF